MKLPRLMDGVLDFLYPGNCAGCLNGYDPGGILCRECERDLENLSCAARCERCAMPLVEEGAPCPYCLGKGVALFEEIAALGVLTDPLRGLIHRIKYSGDWTAAEGLADRLLEKEEVKKLLAGSDCIVATPLHYRRQVSRGFNQAAVIAERLGRRTGRAVLFPLVRVRATETQTALHSRAQRVENLRGAFALKRAEGIEGKRVVVVDDVMTTGATLHSVASALKAAKPARVSAVVLAVADPKGRGFEAI